MPNYIVGDIHGCHSKLTAELERIGFDKNRDTLYSVGDLCDRGDENLKTLEFLYSLGGSFRPVFGNHDIWLYHYFLKDDVNECWYFHNGGKSTYDEVSGIDLKEKEKYAKWLSAFPYEEMCGNWTICHNFMPSDTLFERLGGLSEKDITLGNAFQKGFVTDYDYDGVVYDRKIARFVITMSKGKKDWSPWFDDRKFSERFSPDRNYIMGHTPTVDGTHRYRNLLMIDTGAFATREKYDVPNDGFLTVMELDSGGGHSREK